MHYSSIMVTFNEELQCIFKNVKASPKFVLDIKMTNKRKPNSLKATSLWITFHYLYSQKH